MKIKSIKDCKNLKGKKVFLRNDFNVPIRDGKVMDEYKIVKQLPTINYLVKNKCKLIICTHLSDSQKSAEIVCKHLSKILAKKVEFAPKYDFFAIGTAISRMEEGDILMLENVRFHEGEKKNSTVFAKHLAKLADVYVNDAFAVSHRAHASVSAIKSYIPSYAGLLLANEVKHLDKVLHPKEPLVVIVGGVKLDTKIPLIKSFEKKAFRILVGGALANNFLAAHGWEIGKSIADEESIKFAKKLKSKNILLPLDVVVSTSEHGKAVVKKINEVNKNDHIFDIGPKTVEFYSTFIKRANTIIWNGPMGFFEIKSFQFGTKSIARLVASRSSGRAFGAVGGGETVEALKKTKMFNHIDWVSTGGGAMLSFLGGEKMPGLAKIIKK
jgi:phosphoglycerate kinase